MHGEGLAERGRQAPVEVDEVEQLCGEVWTGQRSHGNDAVAHPEGRQLPSFGLDCEASKDRGLHSTQAFH